MKFTSAFLVLLVLVFLGCQKNELLLEEKPSIEKDNRSGKDSTAAMQQDTVLMPANDEIIHFTEFSDTSKIKFAPGFEKYLIGQGIDPDPAPNGYILYRYIKNIDSLIINEWFDAGDRNLTGIEGFSNLRIFATVSLGVENIDFSSNPKLEYFKYTKYAHCMGCGTLTSLKFGKQSNLQSLNLLGAEKLSALDFENLKKLRILKILNTDHLRNQDISECREIEKIELDGSAEIILANHPKLKVLTCGAYPHHVDFTKLPGLESLRYLVLGRHALDFSANKELKDLYLSDLRSIKLDISANKKLEKLEVYGSGQWTQSNIDLRNNVNLKKCVLTATQLSEICVKSLTDIDFTTWKKDDNAQYKVCK